MVWDVLWPIHFALQWPVNEANCVVMQVQKAEDKFFYTLLTPKNGPDMSMVRV